jgi:hypothetical protein
MTYLILTESSKRYDRNTLRVADALFSDGYTVFHGFGSWLGKREKSLGILVAGSTLAWVVNVAKNIKLANNQQSIMVLAFNSDPLFV